MKETIGVITSYSIHYTKLYELTRDFATQQQAQQKLAAEQAANERQRAAQQLTVDAAQKAKTTADAALETRRAEQNLRLQGPNDSALTLAVV